MSFEPNDMNTIHLGNYEEFFILYMDNELSDAQVKMVDEFLRVHPDLRSEFEILMSTKLPLENFSFDKKDLFAENVKLSSVDEELLLYIDDELTADKKKTVELELTANKDYQLQHQVLLQTKLDPTEKIVYPDKKGLYRKTERIISIKVWMRVAAAAVIIAIGGIVYFKNPPSIVPTTEVSTTDNQSTAVTNPPVQSPKPNEPANATIGPSDNLKNNDVAINNVNNIKENKQVKLETKERKVEIPVENATAQAKQETKEDQTPERLIKTDVQVDKTKPLIAFNTSKDIINTGSVTNLNAERKTIKGPEETQTLTDNDRKGSLKGFLRKATRVIEKRTGIDPTNSNGELLIGAVAINLK